jgi:hypothetical protein
MEAEKRKKYIIFYIFYLIWMELASGEVHKTALNVNSVKIDAERVALNYGRKQILDNSSSIT